MDDLQTWMDHAVRQHQAGNLTVAEPMYRKVLAAEPGHLDAMYLLGTLRLQAGDCAGCVALLSELSEHHAGIADVHNNLGIAYNGLGRWEEAAREFQRAIQARPDYDQAHFNLGSLLEQRGFFRQAEQSYRQAVELNPDDTQALFNLAHVLKSQRQWDDAEDCYVKLLSSRMGEIDVLVNLGYVLVQQEKLEEAIDAYEQVLAQRPDYHEVHNNLSFIFERQGRLKLAIEAARRTIEIRPDSAEGYNNLGMALRSSRLLDEAEEAFQEALRWKPEFPLAAFNLGTTRLLRGDYPGGWPGYEQRAATLDIPPRTFAQPRWDGTSLPGGRLLITSEQGLGDALQFVRFLRAAKQKSGAHLILECRPELYRLLQGTAGIDQLIAEGKPLPEFDAHLPLASLPPILGTTLETIPAEIPYLTAPAARVDHWREHLAQLAKGRMTVGIAWRGNPQQARDPLRSCPLAAFTPLADVPDICLISLQQDPDGKGGKTAIPEELDLHDLSPHFTDFAETAAIVSGLDLVISVDTSIVHLAGGLGRPVWNLLAYAADWRWLLDREDTPWYPTMRLLRQSTWGDWNNLLRETAVELARLNARRNSR